MPSATDDPIVEAVLSDDPEACVRYANWALLGRYELTTKLHAIAAISGLVAVFLQGTTTIWSNNLHQTLGANPLAVSIAASVVLATGLKFLTLGAGGLVLSGLLRQRSKKQFDPERLLAVEETAALVGLGTGGVGATIGVGLYLLVATAEPVQAGAWLARLTSPIDIPVTYQVILWWALGITAVCLVAPVLLDRK